jgi:hypothetical protein
LWRSPWPALASLAEKEFLIEIEAVGFMPTLT